MSETQNDAKIVDDVEEQDIVALALDLCDKTDRKLMTEALQETFGTMEI
jgi:hypothetical protein